MKQVGNLIKVLKDMVPSRDSILNIVQYMYVDTTYEMKYGYDLILDSENAKKERERGQKAEKAHKKEYQDINDFLGKAAKEYKKGCSGILSGN